MTNKQYHALGAAIPIGEYLRSDRPKPRRAPAIKLRGFVKGDLRVRMRDGQAEVTFTFPTDYWNELRKLEALTGQGLEVTIRPLEER